MAEFVQELEAGVGVEVITFVSFTDGRPTEVVMAGTDDDVVLHRKLNADGEQAVMAMILAVYAVGMEDGDG